MQCEVLAFKVVKKGRVAVVRSKDKPDLIGEVPCAESFKGEAGAVGTLRTRVTSRDGRIVVVPVLDN